MYDLSYLIASIMHILNVVLHHFVYKWNIGFCYIFFKAFAIFLDFSWLSELTNQKQGLKPNYKVQ